MTQDTDIPMEFQRLGPKRADVLREQVHVAGGAQERRGLRFRNHLAGE